MVIPLYSVFLDLRRRPYMVAKELSLKATVHWDINVFFWPSIRIVQLVHTLTTDRA
jgi:hypothetical protein